ncbi:PDZ domain-containing protein [Rubinisphaera margarita]|uniref:PDZ domain-containing protein n=1 Tax=Rubinisphaera margarita TaxID=2909586 RepID=UPI001EE8F8C8|nr:hypothetical protein [Rubinisphaera margarita]MCG6158597.1 hypothetical protein [Rubinisphaera margarita]
MTRLIVSISTIAVLAAFIAPVAEAGSCSGYSSGPRTTYYRVSTPSFEVRRPLSCSKLPKLGFYGEICRHGMMIHDVEHRSLAWYAGLEEGDVIKKVDGDRIRCDRDWDDALRHACGELCLIVIKCDCGKIQEVHIDLNRNQRRDY